MYLSTVGNFANPSNYSEKRGAHTQTIKKFIMSDVEEAFEAILEGVPYDEIDGKKFDENTIPFALESETIPGQTFSIQQGLTEGSTKYPRDTKLHLDKTEFAMSAISTHNQGYLDNRQVLQIMDALHGEQKRSSELIETIRIEHKRLVSLRRAVILLTAFVILLAVANIGTSFVAVELVKDMQVNKLSHDLVSLDGERVATTPKQMELEIGGVTNISDERRRHLADLEEVACANTPAGHECVLRGMMNFEKMIFLHKKFCPLWPNLPNTCLGDGVSQLLLNCNGVRISIQGGVDFPQYCPEVGDYGWSFWVFPSLNEDYTVQERLWNRTVFPPKSCVLQYQMAAYCLTDNSECAVFATYDLNACPDMHPRICGRADD